MDPRPGRVHYVCFPSLCRTLRGWLPGFIRYTFKSCEVFVSLRGVFTSVIKNSIRCRSGDAGHSFRLGLLLVGLPPKLCNPIEMTAAGAAANFFLLSSDDTVRSITPQQTTCVGVAHCRCSPVWWLNAFFLFTFLDYFIFGSSAAFFGWLRFWNVPRINKCRGWVAVTVGGRYGRGHWLPRKLVSWPVPTVSYRSTVL